MKGDSRGLDPGHRPAVVAASATPTREIVPDRAGHRRRQLHRLAVIAQVRAAYGPAADLRLTPPGPSCCPEGCVWCAVAI
jgi:hypothetical protein